jgi:hypothetical protein
MPVQARPCVIAKKLFALSVVECLPKLTLEKLAVGEAIEFYPRKGISRRWRYWELPGAEVGGDGGAVHLRDFAYGVVRGGPYRITKLVFKEAIAS